MGTTIVLLLGLVAYAVDRYFHWVISFKQHYSAIQQYEETIKMHLQGATAQSVRLEEAVAHIKKQEAFIKELQDRLTRAQAKAAPLVAVPAKKE